MQPNTVFNAFRVPSDSGTITVTIANSASLSGSATVGNRKLLALLVPTWGASAAITFQVSVDNSAFYDLKSYVTGTEISIPAGTHNCAYDVPLEILGFPYVKVRSGTSASPVNQSGGDDVILVVAA